VLNFRKERGFRWVNEVMNKLKKGSFNCGQGQDKVLVVNIEAQEFVMKILVLLLLFEDNKVLIGEIGSVIDLKNSGSWYIEIE
jgi:hypothetical protein